MNDLIDEVIDEMLGTSKKKSWIPLLVVIIAVLVGLTVVKGKLAKGKSAVPLAGGADAASVTDATS